MTDTSSLVTTHPTTEPYPVTARLNSPVPNGTISDSVQLEDDEPYTIKCICAFQDDDGNTVFCEGCETWQHIECYYHDREVPEVHNCTDCEPRHLDARRATERQRRLREQSDGGDQESKRSGTKSQKKKIKEHNEHAHQVNGHHRSDSSSRDQPPAAKKPKTSHKSSASVSSLSGPPVAQPDPRKRSGSTATSLSPSKVPSTAVIPLYSTEFLHLYDKDQGNVDIPSNLFVNLTLAADLASWVKDPSALSRVVNGRSPHEIFTRSESALDPSQWPVLATETSTDELMEINGHNPIWKMLKAQQMIHKDEIVGEVKGKIGLLRDYCLESSNRWPDLRHPQPFVFFHPQLPIYIDSREEGSILRYIRRSCRPNVTMKTFITNDVEYHFCFVANQDIPANSEITAMWYLDPQLFGSSNSLVKQESGDDFQEAAAVCISNVLSHFGGCACHPPQGCFLANVDRRHHPGAKPVNGKRKKAKSKSNISPLGAGRSNTSRAGSEGIKTLDDDEQADNRSTSGSVRGHTHSRDLTPTQTPHDMTFGDSELSARERRKIAAAEKKFEQLESDQHATQRKKKRSSGTSSQTTPTLPGPKQASYFGIPGSRSKDLHVDTGRQSHSPSRPSPSFVTNRHTSPRKTSGPNTPPARSPLGRAQYVDAAHQTEREDSARSGIPKSSPLHRHEFAPLGQRLLKRCHEDRIKVQSPSKQREAVANSILYVSCSPTSHPDGQSWPRTTQDVEIKDADTDATPTQPSNNNVTADNFRFRAPDALIKPSLPSPLPSTAAHNMLIPGKSINGARSGLHVQLPPSTFPPPMAITPGSITSASLQSPADLAGITPSAQTPGSSMAAPSPVKKKLSLGDYLSRRGTLTTPTSEKSQSQATPGLLPPAKLTSQTQSTSPSSTNGQSQNTGPDGVKNEGAISSVDVSMKDLSQPPPSPYLPSNPGLSDHSRIPPS